MAMTTAQLVAMFAAIAASLTADKDRLCALDGVIGDADHGVAMELGFNAVRDATASVDAGTTEPTALFNLAAKSFLNAVGASSGPLYATALMRAGASVKGKAVLEDADMVNVIQAMARGIEERGKGVPGEKTMVDAWHPAALAVAKAHADGQNLDFCLAQARDAAAQGAEATKTMVATKGRSARLGERSLGHMDPGAASAVTIITAMAHSLGQS